MNEVILYLSLLLGGYGISTIAFLIGSLFAKKFKTNRSAYLNTANFLALFISLAVTFCLARIYISNQEPTASDQVKLFTSFLLSGFVPLLWLSQSLRKSVLITIVVLISVNWIQFHETVYNWIEQLYPEPMLAGGGGQASVSLKNSGFLLIIATVLYFTTALLLSQKKK